MTSKAQSETTNNSALSPSSSDRILREYLAQISDLASAMSSDLFAGGGRLLKYPDDDTFEHRMGRLNAMIWKARYQLDVNAGDVMPVKGCADAC